MRSRSASALAVAALLGLPLSLISAPAEALVRYVGFGDSVTRGNACTSPGGGSPPSDIFDDGPGCKLSTPCNQQTQDDADNCGYAYRLAGHLGAEVENAGDAGETIVEGVNRIDGRISAGDDVLLLMEGTNDISSLLRGDDNAITTTAMKNLLGAMVDKATAKGIDTLIISPIHRVCPEFPGTCVPAANGNPKYNPSLTTLDLSSKISDLRDEKHRQKYSAFQHFGKDQGEVDSLYYLSDFRTGHIRDSGYNKFATNANGVAAKAILKDDVLGLPTPIAPSGDVDNSGVFTWDDYNSAEGEGATLWQLRVNGPLGGSFHDDFHEQHQICSAGTCSVDIGTVGAGSYTWEVRAKNLRGPSPFSPLMAFTVLTAPPGMPTLISPPPDPPGPPPVSVTYTWSSLAQASEYRLQVDDEVTTIIDQTYSAASVCSGSTCSATPAATLGSGDYSWRLQGSNAIGDGPWSNPSAFSVLEVAPEATTLTYPLTDVFDMAPQPFPTFRWLEVDNSDEYELEVDGGAVVLPASICGAGVCETANGVLAIGGHSWRVRGLNSGGPAPWTASASFDVLECASPLLLELDAGDTGTLALFQNCGKIVAGSGFTVQSGEDVTFHAGVTLELQDGFVVESGADFTCRNDR